MPAAFPWNRSTLLAATAGLCLATCGCQHLINPFVDDLPATAEVTTASVEGVRAAQADRPGPAPRDFADFHLEAQSGTVDHWPLWWEDPFEDQGSEDDRFAWTEEDYFTIAYGPARFILNTVVCPVSAVVTPPGTVLCSDGELSRQPLGYDHDPTPCPAGTAPTIDIMEMGTYESAPPPAMGQPPEQTGIEVVPVE